MFGALALALFMPGVFQEFDVTHMQKMATVSSRLDALDRKQSIKLPPPNYWVLAVLLFSFWLYFINFVILETCVTAQIMCFDVMMVVTVTPKSYFFRSGSEHQCAWTSLIGASRRPSCTWVSP